MAVSLDGGTFATRVRLDQGADTAAHPHLAASGTRVAAVWEEDRESAHRVSLQAFSRNSDGHRRPSGSPVSAADSDRPAYPAVAVTGEGTVVAWSSSTGIRVQHIAR
jgi:hypothetical protein